MINDVCMVLGYTENGERTLTVSWQLEFRGGGAGTGECIGFTGDKPAKAVVHDMESRAKIKAGYAARFNCPFIICSSVNAVTPPTPHELSGSAPNYESIERPKNCGQKTSKILGPASRAVGLAMCE
jgi:hypothetical protein